MPFGRNSKNKRNVKQKDHPQPIVNVNLPETNPAPNSVPIASWDALGKDSDQDRQRRPSKTSGASREEISFGQDEVTPPPGRRKPTVKFMAHKFARIARLSKGASNSEDEHQTPLSPTTYSQQVPDEATSVDVHSPRDVRNGSGLEGVSEHPLSPNCIPTLESYIEPSQDKVEGTVPQLEKAGSTAATQQRDTSPSTAGTLSNTPGQSEEQIATDRRESSGDKKKQEDGLARAAKGSRNTSQDVLGRMIPENKKLKEELKLLRDELAAKETTQKDLETRLDKKEIAYNQQLEARLSDIRAAQIKLEAKEKDRQTAADELAKREAELRDDLNNKDVEYQNVVMMFVAKETELHNLKEEMSDKETMAKTLTHDLEEKLKQQLKDAENKHKEQLNDKQAEHTQTVEDLKQQVKDELEKLSENHKSEITKAEDKLKAEHEVDINRKALQIEKLYAEVERLQQEVQDNHIQFEQAATAAAKEARQMNDEDQQPTEKVRAQIEAEVEEKHRERVAKEMAEALEQAQELIREKDELASKLKYESEQRAKQLQEEHDEKVTELTRKHYEESRNQKKAASEQTYLTQLEDARKQHDQVVMEMTQGQGASQGSLKAQIETEIEAKYQQNVEESQQVKEEELTRQANEIEQLSLQLKNAENEIQKVQESKKTMQEAEHLLMHEAKRKEQEIERLSNELKSQVEILGRFQRQNEHLKGQYHQLEVHAQAKQELSVANSSIPSEGDDGEVFHTPPLQRATSAAAVPRDTEISKFIDNEAFLDRAKETKLDHQETVAITQAIGLPAPTKRLCYVFAVFPTNLHDHSVVLDYTGCPQTGAELEGVVEAAHQLQHGTDEGEEEEQFFDTNETLTSEQMADDNRTDAEKLEEVVKESEGLRDELERLIVELTIKEQKLEAANVEAEGLRGNRAAHTRQVQKLKAANAELKEIVRAAAAEVPASPVGVQQGEDTGKMLKQMRARYLEQVTKTLEDEKYENEQKDLAQQHKREKQEWWTRYEKKKQELTEKIQEKKKENKQLRNRSPTQTHPELSRSFSYEEPPEDVDPRVHIGRLQQALKSREGTIEELNHKQLKSNSKAQSITVMNLRRELEKTQAELAVARSESESTKKIQDLDSKVSEVKLELKQLQRAKNEIEDERDLLKNEISAEKNNNDSLKKQLAQSQTMVTTLRTRTTEPVGVDDKDQEIQILKTEANLYQIELEELRRNDARSKRTLAELGRSELSLEQKLANVSKERDGLAQQILQLQAVRRDMKGRLDKVNDLKTQVDVTHEHIAVLSDAVVSKTEEVDDLKEQIEHLKEELDASRFQAKQYEEDFKEKRRARAQAVGKTDSDYGKFSTHVQKLSEKLVQAQEAANEERDQKQAVITKLESTVGKIQQLQRQSDQTDKDYQHALETKGDELRKIADENTQLMGQMVHFRNLSQKNKHQLEIMAAQKSNIDNELSHTKANNAALAMEVQEGRQQLEATIADTSRLSDEVLAKTQQVRQYKKQTDSYKAKLEETAARLQEAQRELQFQSQQVVVNEARVKELKRHLSEHAACIRRLQQNVMRNREDNQALLAVNQQLQVTLSRAQRIQQRIDFMLKQTQAQLPPKQKAPPQYDERSLRQHAVRVHRAMTFDKPISEGSYGAVYAVEHDSKPCIAKRLHDILVGRKPTFPISEQEKDGIHQKFVQECVLLSQMQHPNVVKFIGVISGRDKYDLTLLMERLSTDLHVYLLNNANIPLSLKVSILHDVSCGLLYLHECSIIHRDLSAGNVLLTSDMPMQAKIADLGMSRFVHRDILQLTNAPGAQAYMSPEALQSEKYNESLDLFSFGVISLFAAIQEFPKFSHARVPEAIHVKGEGEIYKRRSWIDKMNTKQPELSSIVLWCLQDDPMKRPSTFCLNILLNEMRRGYPFSM